MSAFEEPKITSSVECPQNDTKNSAASPPLPKLSYRFATDEIDAEDIAVVVNKSYNVECLLDGSFYFRSSGPKITAKEVRFKFMQVDAVGCDEKST
jgi:hypothetical protein